MEYWSGKFITSLKENEVFVFGSNPEGRHGAGAAKAAVSFGCVYGESTGFSPNQKTYAIITKNLKPNYTDKYGVNYPLAGERSISTDAIRNKIDILYKTALEHQNKRFIITYQFDTYPNGTPKKSLNGYDSQEMLEMFVRDDIPSNIVFHDSYKPHLEKLLKKTQKVEDNSPIAFTKVALSFGWMGNMAPYPVEHEGITYKTTEALFQSLRFSQHPEIQEAIRSQGSPMGAKMATKPHRHLLEADGFEMMGAQDVENMRLCIRLKLEQHPQLAQQLIDTGNRPIIEDCTSRPRDSGLFWGAAYQEGKWVGSNVLGEILMEQRAELQNRLSNTKEQFTFFFETKDVHSQWTPSLFKYKEYEFISTEQFMMFSKAKTFKDEGVAQKIMGIGQNVGHSEQDNAIHDLIKGFREGSITRDDILMHHTKTWKEIQSRIKQLGREVSNYDDSVWSAKRVPVVRVANREKYSQNPEMMQELLSTQGTTLVEASPYDKIWGIGLAANHPDASTRDKWKGLNLLGETLTELREHFIENTHKTKLKM